MRLYVCILVTLLTAAVSPITNAKDIVMSGNEREDYSTALLSHLLSYSPNKNYRLTFQNVDVPKLRIFRMIANNEDVDIIVAGATKAREKILKPIRYPIYKGLFGWRIPLVHQDNEHLFSPAPSLSQFKKYIPGQLHSWSDTKIIEHNNIRVEKGSDYVGLFHMLNKKRFDYFPRSVLEVFWEYDAHQDLQIAIEPHVLIHYPTASVFYVNKDNNELASDIALGFEMAINDGSFQQLFNHYYGDIVSKVSAQKRTAIHLKNPLIIEDLPRQRTELWVNFANNSMAIN
ncbi:hypothetical protein [Thalassotalea sp. PLHSN55]|uniref:hypothetical protein n=1 Tax=Thalassotalea sp. PLHSN55 TaxID=3435888 RepID=UPI003F85ACD2